MSNSSKRTSRRRALTAAAGALVGIKASQAAEPDRPAPRRSVYEQMGVKHVINATGTVTNLGGSVMPPEVVAAWSDAAKHFVNLVELQEKVGQRIAELIGVEAALVTTGAAGSLLLGTAAVLTRGEPANIAKLPDASELKHEVIVQKSHRSCYDHQFTSVGAKIVEVETAADVARAITPRTGLMFFMNKEDPNGRISRREWLNLARQHRIPTLLDAAADVPPLERLAGYSRMGFDLVAFSGGKAIRGPNDTGLLLGSPSLIAAAARNMSPNCGTIGRALKVGKEDMIALLAAVERFVRLDHAAERREFERRIGVIETAVAGIATVRCERIVPVIANEVPHLIVEWDESRIRLTREAATQRLKEGDPSIQIGRVTGTGDKGILISVLTLQEGEERIVGERLRAILSRP
jgi:D-glucosaminate-6-phosphate ammonia-lyase